MDIFTLLIWVITIIFLIVSLKKDYTKTRKALSMALSMGRSMALSIIGVILAIGFVLALLPPETIAYHISQQNQFFATLLSAVFGTITLIPAFIAFPLIGTLSNAGVGVMPSVAFLTTLTMVGVATFPLEVKEFGFKFTMTRNVLSFIFAIIIAVIMGVLL